MKSFQCQACKQVVFFENTVCERCAHRLGYYAPAELMLALKPDGDVWRGHEDDAHYMFCSNAALHVCNWVLDQDDTHDTCLACRNNRVIPDLSVTGNAKAWQHIEMAKHRLFYSLLKMGLPTPSESSRFGNPLVFDFKARTPAEPNLTTGHDDGIILLLIQEADPSERERIREQFGEAYRTLLGHFRHEIGHYYWDMLVGSDEKALERFRYLFGDERADYAEAQKHYYATGPKPDWHESAISAYATMHPWEDFAESWAHYFHIVDTLESSYAMGIQPTRIETSGLQGAHVDVDPYLVDDAPALLAAWHPVSVAVNNINRSMGLPDLYPFVITPAVTEKLGFIIALIHGARHFRPVGNTITEPFSDTPTVAALS